MQLASVAHGPRRDRHQGDEHEHDRRPERRPPAPRPPVPHGERERGEQDEGLGAGQRGQAPHDPGQQSPAVAVRRAPIRQHRRQRGEHEDVEQRLGHHRAADEDEGQIDRRQAECHQAGDRPPQLRREHAHERDDRRPHEGLRDPRDPQALARGLAIGLEHVIHGAQEVRVAGRAEGRRAAMGQGLGEPVALRDRARMDVVVDGVVAQHVVRRRVDVGDAQHERRGDEQHGDPADASAAHGYGRWAPRSPAVRRSSGQRPRRRSTMKRPSTPRVCTP